MSLVLVLLSGLLLLSILLFAIGMRRAFWKGYLAGRSLLVAGFLLAAALALELLFFVSVTFHG